MFLTGHSDEYRRQHGENIGLDERHKQLQTIHEDTEKHGYDCHRTVYDRSELHRHEYHRNESQYHGMPCHYISKQPDHQ